MALLTGSNKIKTAVFISGTGSNLKNLIKYSKLKKSPISINLIVSNTKKAKGLKYSLKYNIEKKIINLNKKIFENQLINFLVNKEIKLICLAGFMKILSKNFIKKFNGKIINIHPSLLPKYKGLNTHKRVLENQEKFSGCTVHFVSSRLDSGKIILQKKVRVFKKDSLVSLSKRILKQEHILYPKAINKIFFKC